MLGNKAKDDVFFNFIKRIFIGLLQLIDSYVS